MTIVVILSLLVPLNAPAGDGVTGGPLGDPTTPCISPAERARVEAEVAARLGGAESPPEGVQPKFSFYPAAGTLYGDLFTNNFVDLNAGAGLLDFDCRNFTYNGHQGNDTDMRSFGEQAVGVPIFAALDGVVTYAHDGEFDMNTSCSGTANAVIIDHGQGRHGWYWHLRNGSVAVSLGENVIAGQQIGLMASSGCSTYPHLHFEVRDFSAVVEPYAGPCRPGDSEWVDQNVVVLDTYVRDFGATAENLGQLPGLPFELPRSGYISLADPTTRFWMIIHNLAQNSMRRWEFERPDGQITSTGTFNWNNPFYRWSWWWFSFNNATFSSMTGTWLVRLYINEVLEFEVPLEVVAGAGPFLNRPPEPITVALHPAGPLIGDVIFARIGTDLVVDDVDYDIVRYHYVWTVADVEVRNIVSAGHADALPYNLVAPGQTVTVQVTPGDGTADGDTVSASAVVYIDADLNGDGVVGIIDFLQLLAVWGPCGAPCPPFCFGDLDGDCNVGITDFLILLGNWG